MYRFRKGYYADVRTERRCTSAVIYKNGVLAENKERVTDGAFIRVFDGKMWYYASTETLSNVQKELDGLYEAIQDFIDVLAPGGRLAVITFHSLEDRAVKRAFKTAENPCTCPPDFPKCVCGKKTKGKCVNRKPILPSDSETLANNRAHSAKLRIFEKTTIE